MAAARDELRALVKSRLRPGMTPDEAAEAVARMFYSVEDDRDRFDVSVMQHGPDTELLDQRWLVCRLPRESNRVNRIPNRRVADAEPGGA